MRNYILLGMLLLLFSLSISAEVPIANSITQVIPDAKLRYGVNNFKMVMPGVLYRGGSCGGQIPLPSYSLEKLCKDNFKTAVYVYGKNWNTNQPKIIKCGNNTMNYIMRRWDNTDEVHDILKKLYLLIINQQGAMYIHCWYGVHASGYVSAVALRQFCGLSENQAVSYWNSNVPQKIQYLKVQNMIRKFKPYSDLVLTPDQQLRVCPRLTS